jgi:uncharacterized membrane protein YedE/YeeE
VYWAFWAGGLALASVGALHLWLHGRLLAVSGHFTALTQAFSTPPAPEMAPAELRRALAQATAAQFGLPVDQVSQQLQRAPSLPHRTSTGTHVLFFVAIALGALGSAVLDGRLALTVGLSGPIAAQLLGPGAAALPWLLCAGVLVGFGTRMAGGCTSGHGLSGVSRWQPGSVVTTASFLLAGSACAFVLEAVR